MVQKSLHASFASFIIIFTDIIMKLKCNQHTLVSFRETPFNIKMFRLTFANGTAKFSGRMLETGNYNKSVARKAMVPSVTLDRVRPTDWYYI